MALNTMGCILFTNELSLLVKKIAEEERVGHISVYETMSALILASSGRAFTRFRFLPFYRDAFRVLVLGKSPDEVSELHGWRYHTVGVHLNSRGGMIVADLIQEFIDSNQPGWVDAV